MVQTSGKHPRIDNVSEVYLWHCRLGHINKNRINRLAQEGILEVGDCESLPTCESCLLGKMTKSPFTGKGERASELLGLVHSDVCGSMSTVVIQVVCPRPRGPRLRPRSIIHEGFMEALGLVGP